MQSNKKYEVVDFGSIEGVPCPCGITKRAFVQESGGIASIHRVVIQEDAKVHYHKKTTEIYYVLNGTGQIELDGDLIDIGPGVSVLIRPGCRHRAIGEMEILNIPIPAFDPEAEWFD